MNKTLLFAIILLMTICIMLNSTPVFSASGPGSGSQDQNKDSNNLQDEIDSETPDQGENDKNSKHEKDKDKDNQGNKNDGKGDEKNEKQKDSKKDDAKNGKQNEKQKDQSDKSQNQKQDKNKSEKKGQDNTKNAGNSQPPAQKDSKSDEKSQTQKGDQNNNQGSAPQKDKNTGSTPDKKQDPQNPDKNKTESTVKDNKSQPPAKDHQSQPPAKDHQSQPPAKDNKSQTPAKDHQSGTPVEETPVIKPSPGISPSVSSTPVQVKSEGALRGYGLTFRGKSFVFEKNPMAYIDGEIYICAGDPDFKGLFDAMGLTYNWFSYSGKLFIFHSQGSVTWQIKEQKALIGDKEVEVPLTAREHYGEDYVPLKSIAYLLNLEVIDTGQLIEIKPALSVASQKCPTEGTIDITLSSSAQIDYSAKYDARPPAVRLTMPGTGYNSSKENLFVEGVQIRVNNEKDPKNLFLTVLFPPHWKGEIIPTSFKNQMVIRLRPNIIYSYGMKDTTIEDIQLKEEQDGVGICFKSSSSLDYYWSYSKEEGALFIDMPFAVLGENVKITPPSSHLIRNFEITQLKPDNINFVRIRLDLAEDSAFKIGEEENSFAFLIASASKIDKPAPETGGNSVSVFALGSDSVAGGEVIVIDPGHGGCDPGACNNQLGLQERHITLDISLRLAKILTAMGYKVILTRYTDRDVTYAYSPNKEELQARADVANKSRASMFVSIHTDASAKKERKGSTYYWHKEKDRELAAYLEGSLGPNIGTVDVGLRRNDFYVLTHTTMPACLVETAYLSNPQDAQILGSEKRRQKIAEQLSKAIDMFMQYCVISRKNSKGGAGK